MKTRKQIDELIKRYDSLTEAEKMELRDDIILNDETRNIAINGAIRLQDYSLALLLSAHVCS